MSMRDVGVSRGYEDRSIAIQGPYDKLRALTRFDPSSMSIIAIYQYLRPTEDSSPFPALPTLPPALTLPKVGQYTFGLRHFLLGVV
jgi:hypothetical protein